MPATKEQRLIPSGCSLALLCRMDFASAGTAGGHENERTVPFGFVAAQGELILQKNMQMLFFC